MAITLFGILEARHFCSSYAGAAGTSQKSLEDFQKTALGTSRNSIPERSVVFQEYRDCSLREVERCMFLSASHYRRVLDLMVPSASHWAYVTLYYGSWYAAHAILAMFGCAKFKNVVVDVEVGTPEQQRLRQRRFGNKAGQYKLAGNGSHQTFWHLFYDAVTPLTPLVTTNLGIALAPIQNNPVWQTENRNNVNYDTYQGLQLAERFKLSFSQNTFPKSLPGILGTQFGVLERLLEISFQFADQLQISTDALANLAHNHSLRAAVRQMVYTDKPPALIRKTQKSKIT